MTNQLGGMVLSIDEELYLTERANYYELFSPAKYNDLIEQLSQKYASPKHFQYIRKSSHANKAHKITNMKGFWQQACKKILEEDIKKF